MKVLIKWLTGAFGLALLGMAIIAYISKENIWIGPSATALTGAVVLWYTVETQRLRRIANRQLKVSGASLNAARKLAEDAIQPMLMFSSGSEKDGEFREKGDTLFLRNLGNGAAFNIHVGLMEWPSGRIEFRVPQVLDRNRHTSVEVILRVGETANSFLEGRLNSMRDEWHKFNLPARMDGKILYISGSSISYETIWSLKTDARGDVHPIFASISRVEDRK